MTVTYIVNNPVPLSGAALSAVSIPHALNILLVVAVAAIIAVSIVIFIRNLKNNRK